MRHKLEKLFHSITKGDKEAELVLEMTHYRAFQPILIAAKLKKPAGVVQFRW